MKHKLTITFGKHKGKDVEEIPNSWFQIMHARGLLSGELKRYAEERIPGLRSETSLPKDLPFHRH